MSKNTTRGVRNHNPGNLRRSKDPWQGLAATQGDREFFTFKGPAWGIRALAKTLITYQDKYGLRTVRTIINRWAPPKGDRNGAAPGGEYRQDTSSYVRHVAEQMGVDPDDRLDLHDYDDLYPLVVAIIAHECAGYRYPADVVRRGLELAGVLSRKPSGATEGAATVAAGGVAAATTIGAVVEAIQPALPIVQQLADRWPLAVFAMIAVGAVAYGVWRLRRAKAADGR